MAFTLRLTQEEFEKAATNVIEVLMAESVKVMQFKLQQDGFVLTAELLRSIQKQSIIEGRSLYAEFSIGFKGYGRFKDMRRLLYNNLPPIDVLEEYVREVGLDKFKYVPGYLLGAKYRVLHIPDNRAINRIAWGIGVNRLKMGVKGKRRNTFYNTSRGHLIYETSNKMIAALGEPILRGMKEEIEK